jgi:hypothetical protein
LKRELLLQAAGAGSHEFRQPRAGSGWKDVECRLAGRIQEVRPMAVDAAGERLPVVGRIEHGADELVAP